MVNEEFKLNLYFNMYKDYPIGSRDCFRQLFTRKHGRYNYLPELILMIEKYQREKFGITLWYDKRLFAPSKKKGAKNGRGIY